MLNGRLASRSVGFRRAPESDTERVRRRARRVPDHCRPDGTRLIVTESGLDEIDWDGTGNGAYAGTTPPDGNTSSRSCAATPNDSSFATRYDNRRLDAGDEWVYAWTLLGDGEQRKEYYRYWFRILATSPNSYRASKSSLRTALPSPVCRGSKISVWLPDTAPATFRSSSVESGSLSRRARFVPSRSEATIR